MEQTGEHAAALSPRTIPRRGGHRAAVAIRLSAVIVTATIAEPRMLTVRLGHDPMEALPSGPLEVEHRTLEVGLRAWVERQTAQKLGYVEQLYTFGDRDRVEDARAGRALTVAYLALVREARQRRAAGDAPAPRTASRLVGEASIERDGTPAAGRKARSRLRPSVERGA